MLFLSLLDHSTSRGNIIVVATTNDISRVDKSLLRDGRFAFTVELAPPSTSERRDLILKRLRGIRYSEQTIETVAQEMTEGNTCDEITEMTERAVFAMFNKKQFPSDQEVIEQLNAQIQLTDFTRIGVASFEKKQANKDNLNDLSFNDLMSNHQNTKNELEAYSMDDTKKGVFDDFYDIGQIQNNGEQKQRKVDLDDPFAEFL